MASDLPLLPLRPATLRREQVRLVTEQTCAGGKRADGRVLDPDLYDDDHELILTVFVTPLESFVTRIPNLEARVRVALSSPAGSRELINGAVYEHSR